VLSNGYDDDMIMMMMMLNGGNREGVAATLRAKSLGYNQPKCLAAEIIIN
jgi:hypothetical protein